MNTRILAAEYEYLAPATIDEVLDILAEKPRVRILAGGTDLIVKLKTVEDLPLDYMLDIKHVAAFDYIRYDDKEAMLHIGPTATLSRIEKDALVRERYPALAEAIHLMAAVSVRNMGTMAGNICNASPVADSVIPAICYQAVLTLTSKSASREIPLHEFFLAPGVSVIKPDELLTDIALPLPKPATGAAFVKKTRVRPDIAKISIGALIEHEGGIITACRIAMAAIAATPAYLKAVGDSMVGYKMSQELIAATAALAAQSIKPIDDNRTTAKYRLHIAEVMTADVLHEAWKRAGGEL
ncbi:MAG: FAD binding domain-containing protein [Clostridiales bacterium]|nr:FAD binding domain-containing protein [Clostridiales bacterium]